MRGKVVIPVIVGILVLGILTYSDAAAQTLVTNCEDLDIPGETYVLQNDITSTTSPNCFTIKANNITFDGNGFTITDGGTTNVGISVNPVSGVTIKNVEVIGFGHGIFTNGGGNHVIEGNTARQNDRGINFNSANTLVTNNHFQGNIVNGIFGAGTIIGSTVTDNTLINTAGGIQIHGDGISITDNTLDLNNNGIIFVGADDNTVTGNMISRSLSNAMSIDSTSNNNLVSGNTVNNAAGSAAIIILNNAFDNTITDNFLSSNGHGVRIIQATGNTVSGNTITSNTNGVLLQAGANNNVVFNNNFESNSNQVVVQAGAIGNIFDFPAPVGGNFYKNFDQPGEGCNDTSPADGFCDAPFVFSGGQDNLPWTLPLAGGVPIPDTDGDGLLDHVDNCPLVPNAGQADSNNNGIGDVCDPETLLIAQLQADADSDGFPDAFDQCDADPLKVIPGVNGCGSPEPDFAQIISDLNDIITNLNSQIFQLQQDLAGANPVYCGIPQNSWPVVIRGTENDDKLVGTQFDDLIFGYGGNDKIQGKQGNDCLIGGQGNDNLQGNKGNDNIFGNEGDDKAHGGQGDDTIDGGNGNDRCHGAQGTNIITNCEKEDKSMKEEEDDE